MSVSLSLKQSVASFIGYLKDKNSLIIFNKDVNLKQKHRNQKFWCLGYYEDTAGKNLKTIAKYISNHYRKIG
ncbi:TPA: transposase [Streptococcus equi subsp. zooepidemicus]|nr:transposase [Streptococcus equi subsp. zooepidemicus]MCD3387978.1 transposase [Streptococcus equi subsp. zooepidemicus]MCD3399678.1 transposase [Streptococcus equi subsp. zooepidemicus]MCD3423805.1 transposase [Streptococcus equi subsp. zooepidemicus]MCD3451954.1 transposase [Streptococcus equi subsp. zooepidemicus]